MCSTYLGVTGVSTISPCLASKWSPTGKPVAPSWTPVPRCGSGSLGQTPEEQDPEADGRGMGRNRSEALLRRSEAPASQRRAVFCFAVALSARPFFALRASKRSLRSSKSDAGLRSNTPRFAFLPAQERGVRRRRVHSCPLLDVAHGANLHWDDDLASRADDG